MGKQRIVKITSEVGGSLTSEYLQQPPPAPARRQVPNDDWMWRDLYGAPASGTSPEVVAAREQRRWANAQAIGEPSVEMAVNDQPPTIVEATLPPDSPL